ncbi:MAG TPA: helix-hairpin-helix domain-containing protein [Pyrinomonadaceae bacterium]|nr:helix-hairpin-helix domain-containing protein [Acidobacteriota bacterium]HQZ95608.1 helix-hairpin-helix domain-containing protein [Pyrinomonadaceae bacterium]
MCRIILLVAITSCFLLSCSRRIEHISSEIANSSNGLNINTATVDELEKLPHIGRKTAESIVEFRTANGPFRRVEHLMQIRGISEERFVELRPLIKTE